MQWGFFQIPNLILIVAGILFLGAGYVVVTQYQNQQPKESANFDSERIAELEKKLAELESREDSNDSKQEVPLETSESFSQKQTTPKPSHPSVSLDNPALIQKIKPAVVYIKTSNGSGSGFVIESNGYILTNAHVVSGVDQADVTFSNGDYALAAVYGTNEVFDIALLKVNRNNLPKIDMGSSDEKSLPQGTEIFTFGFPFGIEGDVSFKEGTVSRRLREGQYLEISAEIHPGNSGGPLVNRSGQVVGINTAAFSTEQVEGIILGESIKFAISADHVKRWLPYLKEGNIFRTSDSDAVSNDCSYTESQKQNYLSFVQVLEEGKKAMSTGVMSTLFVWKKIADVDLDGASADLNKAMSYFSSANIAFEDLVSLIPDGVPESISGAMNDVVNLRKEVLGYRIQATEITFKIISALETGSSVKYFNFLQDEEEKYSGLAHDQTVSMVAKEAEIQEVAGSYFCE